MKLINYSYETLEALEHFSRTYFKPNDYLFIQLFCGDVDLLKITKILHFLKNTFPKCSIIGASTAGEIKSGRIKNGSIQISFCQLERSISKVYYFPDVNEESGKKAGDFVQNSPNATKIILDYLNKILLPQYF